MGEGLTRRRYGRSHPGSGTGAWAVHPPRWTLGENPSSQTGRDLAPKARTAQNFRNQWLRISGTHTFINRQTDVMFLRYLPERISRLRVARNRAFWTSSYLATLTLRAICPVSRAGPTERS